jgi:hypothetical protein
VDTKKSLLKQETKMLEEKQEINTKRSSQANLSSAALPAADQQSQPPPKVLDRTNQQTSQQQPPRSILQHSDSHGSDGRGGGPVHGSGRFVWKYVVA